MLLPPERIKRSTDRRGLTRALLWGVAAERLVNATPVVVDPELCQLSRQVDHVPKKHTIEILAPDRADADTAELGIAALYLDDRRDEFRGWSFRAGFTSVGPRRKKKPVLSIDQGLVELEERSRLEDRREFRNPMRAQEQSSQSEHEAIKRSEIRGAVSEAITDQELMLQQQRFGGDARTPPGRRSFATVTSRWTARSSSLRVGRTLSRAPIDARLRDRGGLRYALRIRHGHGSREASETTAKQCNWH